MRVPDLRKHKRVKNKRLNDRRLMRRVVIIGIKPTTDLLAQEVEEKNDEDHVYRLASDLLHHINSEKRVGFLVGLAVEQDFGGRIRRERKRSKSVHYEIDP